MARYFDVHPQNPQPRSIAQVVALLRDGRAGRLPDGLLLRAGLPAGQPRRASTGSGAIRQLDDKHHFTLVCADFAQLGQLVQLDNAVFRAVKAATPGPYTFILPATREVPRRLLHPKKRRSACGSPTTAVVQALLAELGEPLLSSTLLLPDEEEPMTEGWEIKEELDHLVDAVVDAGDCGTEPTTVVDFSERRPGGRPRRRRRPVAVRVTG